MSNFKPITTKAKCDYSNLPVNQEVTVDAKGTTPVKLGYESPLKKPLVGNQDRLPDHLKAKILASPAKQTKRTKKANMSKSVKPLVEYTNMSLMNSVRTQDAQGVRQANPAPPTARDSASYREGFNFGVKNWKNPPKNGFPWENEMFRGGRWEGQNKAKKLAEKQSPNKKRYCKK